METAANRQCDKDFATDVGAFSEAVKHNIRRQRPATVLAYAAVASDETKSFQVFTEPNVKANSAWYRENAGRKRVSVVKNAYENQYISQCHPPEQCTGSHSRKTRRLGVSHPDIWCREHLSSSITEGNETTFEP